MILPASRLALSSGSRGGKAGAVQNPESFLEVDFSWVADPKLRDILQQFHTEAVDAYGAKRHVAAVVLSGAVLEGMLTFALMKRESEAKQAFQTRTGRRSRAISEWRLEELVEVASRLGLIGETAARAAPAVRDFRNMIHPHRLLRRSQPRWDALAALALAAVAEISRSLSGRIG